MKRRDETILPIGERVSYVRSYPSVWDGLLDSIAAYVELMPKGWLAGCHVSLPNVEREQWNTLKFFESRDDAARYAADFVAEAERIVGAMQRGEQPWLPHREMRKACLAVLDTDPGLLSIERKIVSAPTRERGGLQIELRAARQAAEFLWFRANDFRDFLEPNAARGAA